MNMHVPALQRSIPDVVAEYDLKADAVDAAIAAFKAAGTTLKTAATIGGTYGDRTLDVGDVRASELRDCLLRSAWKHMYSGLNIDQIASAEDKKKWQSALEKPAPFTVDNIRGTFGKYILDPRGNILRGLAEVFCRLDPAYRSHDRVKIGVAGLPKRVIVGNVGYSSSYGRDKLRDMFNALAAFQEKPLIEYKEFEELDQLHNSFNPKAGNVWIRGIEIKKFQNGNAHVIFNRKTLRDVNKALAEFYGDVLPDTTDEKPTAKQASTAVSKDLQYYPTPVALVESVLHHRLESNLEGKNALEPNCGCGRIMDALRKRGADVFGVEVDAGRAAQARAKGHSVMLANFLETSFNQRFDIVAMNPPFYGKHYAKHVRHAFDLLAPGGTLIAILPATAPEHGLLDDLIAKQGRYSSPWSDLPVGSFSESGTNINTVVLTLHAPR